MISFQICLVRQLADQLPQYNAQPARACLEPSRGSVNTAARYTTILLQFCYKSGMNLKSLPVFLVV